MFIHPYFIEPNDHTWLLADQSEAMKAYKASPYNNGDDAFPKPAKILQDKFQSLLRSGDKNWGCSVMSLIDIHQVWPLTKV